MNLAPIALKYGSDKCRFHSYGPVYDSLFEGKTVRKVLEIGIGYKGLMTNEYPNGASLLMWAEYFPDAEIYGLDIRPDCLIQGGRIHSFQCDQGNLRSLIEAREKVGFGFDLIVDDGSHESEHQVLAALVLHPYLKLDGKYVIEDVRSPGYVLPFLPFKAEVLDLDIARLYDDRMIISV